MRKRLFATLMMVVCMLFVIGGCTKREETAVVPETTTNEVDMEEMAETVYPVEVENAEEFTETDENLRYKGKDLSYDYEYDGYMFSRFEDFLSVSKVGEESESALIPGYNFVLTDNSIWFATCPDRKVAATNFRTLDLSQDFELKDAVVYRSYDLYDQDVASYPIFEYDDLFDVEGKTLICGYEIPYTVLLDGERIWALENGETKDYWYMPFKIKQMAYTNSKSKDDDVLRVTYLSDTNVVGVLEFSEYGINNNVIDSDSEPKELYVEKEDEVVYTQDRWAVYKKNGKTIASDGGLVCDMDSLQYNETGIGDNWGIGRGSKDSAIIFIPIDMADRDKSTEELVQKYAR